VLLPRAVQCEQERGQIPNFVAVNYVADGDTFAVVDELNGVAG
jgi:endonuclease YncB( thermonuclease family)